VIEPTVQLIKASQISVTLTSGATVGGILIAMLAGSIVVFFFRRRRKVTEVDDEMIDEFGLPTECGDKLELAVWSADEGENCLVLDDDEEDWAPSGDDLGLHFDGEDSKLQRQWRTACKQFELDVSCTVSPYAGSLASCQSGSALVQQ
jgi:hypothetical protein